LGATASEESARPDHGTQYSGVTQDNIVSYLELNSSDRATLSLIQADGEAQKDSIDFTVACFFKLD
jgi:hypothetical protein